MPEFVHLHNHTHYSLLDGACSIDGLIQAAGENNMSAVGLTDHGVNFGLLEFYQKAKKAGIKPIMGCEVYVADGDRFDKSSLKSDGKQRRRNYFHLILLAKNYDGYRTLNRLTSRAHTEGFYYKPRIDRQLLQENHEGLICLSACAGGVVSAHLVNENMDAARESAIWYRELFGEDFYLEIQDHGIPVDKPVLEGMPMLAKELNIPLVGTNDCHYIRKEHAIAHNVLLHIRDASGKGVDVNVEEELRYGTTNYYFKSAQEMADLFRLYPEAIERSVEIAEKCDVKIPTELYMPNFPIPQTSQAGNLDEYLTELTYQGTERRYHNIPLDVKERVDFELDVIIRMGYSGYFLIVQDFIQAARDRGVRVGPGRGSAAGSLVAYALGITDIDPLKYDLLFERFLNPDRVSMPDIDVDFADDKREMVIEYVKQKYGEEAVSQIITFSTLSSRAVLKDVGRVLGIPHTTINEITKDIQVKFGRVQPLAEAIENAELRWVKESSDLKIKKLIDYSLVLEGFCRAASTHAAGVVIAPGPLEDYIPLYKTPTTGLASQYTMKYLEDAGLLKMDFLGLRTLTIIEETLSLIKQRHGLELDIDAVPLDDPKTYEMLGKGLTTAVFQFESPPMQKYLKQLKPERLEDLIAMNALYRPGPMDNIPDFIDRKHGRKEIAYLHEKLEPILGKTYGICVTGDTEVFDALHGKRYRIDELENRCGELLIQGVDENLETSFAPVTHFFDNGVKPVVEVRLKSGATVRMTPDHKVLTEKGWREIGTLSAGDFIATPRSLEVLAPQNVAPERLRVLAYLLADGSLTSGSSVDFVSKDVRMIDEYKRCLLQEFENTETVELTQVRGVVRVQAKGKNKNHYHEPNSLLLWMRALGLKGQRGGKDSRSKFVPDFVFGLQTDDIAFFIASLWDCDGHIGGRCCHYKTISKRLARDLQTLLLRIGIRSDVYESRYFSERRGGTVQAYQVTLYDLEGFEQLIAPHLVAKSFQAPPRSYRSVTDTVSREIFIEELEQSWSGSWRGLMAQHGISRQHFTPTARKRSRIPTDVVTPLIAEMNLPRTAVNTHVHWERIESIADAGTERVYDITVAGIHNFVGNNVILHNCVYQEQIMQIAQQLGGFTLAQADTLRRAMGKKQIQYMEEMKGTYFEGCKEQGIERKTADEIWDMMVKFADYGFNKSHSAAYAYVAYQTAYLKANYAAEFLAANMTNESSDQTKVVKLIDECRAFGVEVLPPNINQSMVNFSVDKQGEIVFGMAGIRNVGASAVSAILEERKRAGKFTSIFDFTKRLAGNNLINRRLLEHLVLAGAFDTIHNNRRQCFEALDSAMGYGGAWAAQRASGMDSLFAVEGLGEEAMIPEPALPDVPEWPQMEKLKREKEVLDFYVSGHPLEAYRLEAETFSEIRFGELPEELDTTKPVRICGVVASVRTKLDRRENQFAIVGVEDFTGKAECVFWSDAWRRNAAMVTEGAMIFVVGRPEIEGADKLRIIADDVIPVNDSLQKFTKGVAVNVRLDDVAEDAPQQTEQLFREHQGEVQCMFRVYDTQGALVGRWTARKMMIAPSRGLIDGLGKIYSPQNVKIVG